MFGTLVRAVLGLIGIGGIVHTVPPPPLPNTQAVAKPCTDAAKANPYLLMARAAVHRYWAPQRQPYHCLYVAQLQAESSWNPEAVSPVGARGLAQVMPKTWEEIASEIDVGHNPFVAADAIRAGAYYDSKMFGIFKAPRPEEERLSLGLASYNAGAGSVIRCQKRERSNRYADIESCLPAETRSYVAKIWKGYREYAGI